MKHFKPNPCPEPGDGAHSWFCDRASLNQQAALVCHLTNYAPLALVVFSGSRSIHGGFFAKGSRKRSSSGSSIMRSR